MNLKKGEMNFKKGERVEIISFNKNIGNYLVSLNGKKGHINGSHLQPDVN